jgi:hypothetical protein
VLPCDILLTDIAGVRHGLWFDLDLQAFLPGESLEPQWL